MVLLSSSIAKGNRINGAGLSFPERTTGGNWGT